MHLCKSKFKRGEFIICKVNAGFSNDFIIGKEYEVLKSSYIDSGSDVIDIVGEEREMTGIFASRFTTLKIERKEKLIKIKKMETKSLKKVTVPDGKYKGLWSGYIVQVIFPVGMKSVPFDVNNGVRGINCKCEVEIIDGWMYVK